MNYQTVAEFENRIAEFFGSKYAVSTDSCTHAIELCLRYKEVDEISVPKHTYLSIPMLAEKLDIKRIWREEDWKEYYNLTPHRVTPIYDAAVLWRKDSYMPKSFMCLSFQYQKHLSLGRGGMILCDDEKAAIQLKKMSYDGRVPGILWREQNVEEIGYHYYCTPETAQLGLDKLQNAIETEPRQWSIKDWPNLTEMKVFSNG